VVVAGKEAHPFDGPGRWVGVDRSGKHHTVTWTARFCVTQSEIELANFTSFLEVSKFTTHVITALKGSGGEAKSLRNKQGQASD